MSRYLTTLSANSHKIFNGIIVTAATTSMADCVDGEIQLQGGRDDTEHFTRDGRIELCFNKAWGTVCNTSFGIPDASVACNQLVGFQRDGNITIILF